MRVKAFVRGLGIDRATDLLLTLNHPDAWQLLVEQRSRTPRRYERWFGDMSCARLLHKVGR